MPDHSMMQCLHASAGSVSDEDKQRLAAQLLQMDEAYPGGLLQYIHNARHLLQDSRQGGARSPRLCPDSCLLCCCVSGT